jgi:hypothetical protein
MVKVYKNLKMVIYIKDYINKVNLKVMVNIIGKIVVTLKDNLKMGYVMVEGYGKINIKIVINIKDNIKMIKNKDMGFLSGLMVMYIKDNILMITEKDMAKCIGLMGVGIKANGRMEYKMEWGRYTFLGRILKKVYFRIMF